MAALALSVSFARVAVSAAPVVRAATISSRASVSSSSSLFAPALSSASCAAPASARRRMATVTSAISKGDKLPDAQLAYLDKDGNMQQISTSELTKGKKVVIFAVPGAFTPTCSQQQLPQFVSKAEELKSKGVDTIACVAVNDAFVMKAWGESAGVADKVMLLADGSCKFTSALGVSLDLTDKGLGMRSKRYSMLVEDGTVKVLNLEEGGGFTISGPDGILKEL